MKTLTLLMLVACGDKEAPANDTGGSVVPGDADGDGYGSEVDCDDNSALIFPGADELCNGLDDDCDGDADEDPVDGLTAYDDQDQDGFGDAATAQMVCEVPDGLVERADDCDDSNPAVNPDASELCNGLDDDCSGAIDDDATDATEWYADADADTYGDPDAPTLSCEAPDQHVDNDGDCDDADAAVNPDADEVCNSIDDDCDGLLDDADDSLDLATASWWFRDADADTYGDPNDSVQSCLPPSGYIVDDSDCDDGDPALNPDTLWYQDADSDGYGDPSTLQTQCEQPSGYLLDSSDCDDGSAAVNPAAAEVCNSIDDDCDAQVDDGDASLDTTTATDWYADADADGYGDASSSQRLCAQPSNTVPDSTDCDDSDAAVFPGATEVCNGIDDDCDTQVDDDDSGLDRNTATAWHRDQDGDSYGHPSNLLRRCVQPTGRVADSADCDDTDATIHPAATEVCNSVDDDCDALVDDADSSLDTSTGSTWFADSDGDGFGDASSTTDACLIPSAHTTDDQDCDDTDAATYPWAVEVCGDGIDQDCNGYVDNTCLDEIPVSSAALTVAGLNSGDIFGASMVVGDMTGDGIDDLLIGAYQNDAAATRAGAAYLAAGPLTSLAVTGQVMGVAYGDYLGHKLDMLGDQDGDGTNELLIAAFGTNTNGSTSGTAYILSGPVVGAVSASTATASITGTVAQSYFGQYGLSTDDLNSDGTEDIVIGAHAENVNTGAAYVFHGPVTTHLEDLDYDAKFTGPAAYSYAGIDVHTADMNGDGAADLVVGGMGRIQEGTPGTAWIFNGPVNGALTAGGADWSRDGDVVGDAFGSELTDGDFDGDGHQDLAVGARYEDTGAVNGGAVYMFLGSSSGPDTTPSFQLYGDQLNDYLGHYTDEITSGDLNGDGKDELLVGWHYDDSTVSNGGAVYISYGPMSGTWPVSQADQRLHHTDSNAYMGREVVVADILGDGLGDVLVGSGAGFNNEGEVSLFLGSSL